MNLYPLSVQLDAKIRGFSRRHRIKNLVDRESAFRSLLVIGDGEPDDLVSCVVSHHLNGDETVGIVKPQRTGIATFQFVSQYLTAYPKIERELFLMDQEELSCKVVRSQLEEQLRKQKAVLLSVDTQNKERLCIYSCSTGVRKFEIVLVLNGLDEISAGQHVVEDHLLMAAHRLGIKELPNKTYEPKMLWRTLSDSMKNEVYQRLTNSAKLCSEVLPQQVNGFGILKSPFK